jgi:hypothetical protein
MAAREFHNAPSGHVDPQDTPCAMGLASLACMVARTTATILALPSRSEKRRVHFIRTPLRLVDKLELELREVFGWHPRGSPAPGIQAGDV